jgi:hypothetical protein
MVTTLNGAELWTDDAMRSALRAHLRETGNSTHRVADKSGCAEDALTRWLFNEGIEAKTVFKGRIKHYLRSIGYGGDVSVANGQGDESKPKTEPTAAGSGHARIDATIAAINAAQAERPVDRVIREMEEAQATVVTFPESESELGAEEIADIELDAVRYDRLDDEVEQRSCRECGCTEDDCSSCVERTGEPCFWVEPDLCSACAAKPGFPIAQYAVDGTFRSLSPAEPIPVGGPPSTWSLPEGFSVLPPAATANVVNPPGLTISTTYRKAHLSRRLHKDELQSPSHVLIATKGDQILIVRATGETPGAMRLAKNGAVSSSVARYVQTIGKPAGFYRAREQDDGSWLIQL